MQIREESILSFFIKLPNDVELSDDACKQLTDVVEKPPGGEADLTLLAVFRRGPSFQFFQLASDVCVGDLAFVFAWKKRN